MTPARRDRLDDLQANVGFNCRRLRKARGWNTEALAERSGVAERSIERLERGENVGVRLLLRLALALEAEPAEMFWRPEGF